MEPTDRKSNWFKSLTRRKKSSNKENNQNVNIDTSVLAIPSAEQMDSAINRQSTTNTDSQSQTSTKSTNVLSWVTMFRKRALHRRRDLNTDLMSISPSENRLMNFERRAVANDYVVGLPNLDIPPDQMYIYSHILTPQQQHNFIMSRVNAMTNQIESPWLIQESSPNIEHLIMLNAQVLMNK